MLMLVLIHFQHSGVPMAQTTPVLKVILVGEYGVGKSSLFRRFSSNGFLESNEPKSTVGLDTFQKTYVTEGKEFKVQLWDTGGLERVASMTSSYFKFAHAAVLVFALDDMDSFHMLSQHLLEVLMNADCCRIFICGNKTDLVSGKDGDAAGPSDEMIQAFYDEHQLTDAENMIRSMYRTSCKTGEGVHEMFHDVACRLARSVRTEAAPDPNQFQLRSRLSSTTEREKGASCC